MNSSCREFLQVLTYQYHKDLRGLLINPNLTRKKTLYKAKKNSWAWATTPELICCYKGWTQAVCLGLRCMGSSMVARAHTRHTPNRVWHVCVGRIVMPNTSSGGHAPQHPTWLKPNMFRSKQCVWIYFSSLIGSETLPECNTPLEIFSGLHMGPLVFYTNPINIILSRIQLKIS
jgi:hypothetical protein